MTAPPPDRSRDRRIEDPTNLWVVHPIARILLPWFVTRGISANAVSAGGLVLGSMAALAYTYWGNWPVALLGLLLSTGWLVADGLDGMVARATGTASAFGRVLDGLCDHGVFTLLYISLAVSIGTVEGWILALSAGAVHAVQSDLYENERARYHRRCNGDALARPQAASRNPLVRLYDHVGGSLERYAGPFDAELRRQNDPAPLAFAYAVAAVRPMRLQSLLSANVRVCAIFLSCLAGDPRWFWLFELGPLTAILIIGLVWHRRVERRLLGDGAMMSGAAGQPSFTRRT